MVDLEARPTDTQAAETVRRRLLRDLATWLRMTDEQREESPLAGTPDVPGIFDAGEDPAEPEWYAWAPDPSNPVNGAAIIVTADDFDQIDAELQLLVQEDIPVERSGRGLCEELQTVRDDILHQITVAARHLDDDGIRVSGILHGLILALGLVLDVDQAEARRHALRKIAADRAWRT